MSLSWKILPCLAAAILLAGPVGAQEPLPQDKIDFATGNRRILVLAIEFPDAKAPFEIGHVDSLMNINTFDARSKTGGFRDYFVENSYGRFVPESDVYGWFESSRSYRFYTDTLDCLSGTTLLLREAIEQADSAGVDFSLFDYDGDGEADPVILVTSAPVDEHFAHLRDTVVSQGIRFTSYTIQEARLGTLAHEYGHALGLRDLYHGPHPFGYYDVMGSAYKGTLPGQFSAYSKILLGWIDPVVIDDSVHGLAVPNSHDQPFAIVIRGQTGAEWSYFVLENRVQKGYDSGGFARISGSGLLIYHVHEQSIGWTHVEQADGMRDLERYDESGGLEGNLGDAGDLFPGTSQNRRFDSGTDPSSKTEGGVDTGISIGNISDPGDVMTIDVDFGTSTPTATEDERAEVPGFYLHPSYPNPFRSSTTIVYSLPVAMEVKLTVHDAVGRTVRLLETGLRVAGTHTVIFEAGELTAGVYFYTLEAGGSVETQRVILTR